MTAFVYLEGGKVVIFLVLCVTPRLLREHSACLRGAGKNTFFAQSPIFRGIGPKCTGAPGPKAQWHRPCATVASTIP